jgi:serine/threonine protein phosphatase 1
MDNHFEINWPYDRTIVIGDIHGCYDELLKLLELLRATEEDVVIAAGDILDRGPASWETAQMFRNKPNFVCVLGNHERRIAGTIRGTSQPAWTQEQTLALLDQGEREDWATWLEDLPAVISTRHAIVTHARLDSSKPLDMQDRKYCAGTGANIERSASGIPVWYYEWKSRNPEDERAVVIGHLEYDRVELVTGGLYAVDTEAVHGHRLTAVVFPGNEIVSVSCEDYYTPARQAWEQSR